MPKIKMPAWPRLNPGIVLDYVPRIKLPRVKLPQIKIPQIRMPVWPRLDRSIVLDRLPRIRLPQIGRKNLLAGSAATLTALALTALFTRYAGHDSHEDTAPAVKNPVEYMVRATPATAGAIPIPQEKPRLTEKSKLSVLENLPAAGNATDQDIALLMRKSKLPRDVVEGALHIFNHATPDGYETRADDRIELVYSQGLDVLYARVHARGTVKEAYGFEDRYGNFGYYSKEGNRIDKSGMISPVRKFEIDSPQLTRVFNTYKHPIFKVKKHHNGIDFPVAKGTSVYAVSDGIVELKKNMRGYGQTVIIKHNGNTQSLYAHLGSYADIKPGTRVKKGELIGYAGSTGRTTGPHLHFEIRKKGEPVNPRTITAFSEQVIGEHSWEEFSRTVARMQNYLSDDGTAIARSTPEPHTLKTVFHRPGDDKIKKIIKVATNSNGIHPDLVYRLFIKEATVGGVLNAAARSDTGALGLCQFTEQTFLQTMKKHGPHLGLERYADNIRSYVGANKKTYYTADAQTSKILDLRKDTEIAIPLCTAYMRDNIDYLEAKLGRMPTFTDASFVHFFGPGAAENIIRAYDDPRKRKLPAYKFASSNNLSGVTNRSVLFKGGNTSKPYSIEEVYNAKRAKMGTEPALITDAKRNPNEYVMMQPR